MAGCGWFERSIRETIKMYIMQICGDMGGQMREVCIGMIGAGRATELHMNALRSC